MSAAEQAMSSVAMLQNVDSISARSAALRKNLCAVQLSRLCDEFLQVVTDTVVR
jgi:hypothetical protein